MLFNEELNQTLMSSYVNRLATRQDDPTSVPNYYGNQPGPTSSFDADVRNATGGTQGASPKAAYEAGGQNALEDDGETQEQLRNYYQ
jgi:hypothetical protein